MIKGDWEDVEEILSVSHDEREGTRDKEGLEDTEGVELYEAHKENELLEDAHAERVKLNEAIELLDVDTDTVGEILCDDWSVKELQPVPVTDDDTH